MYWRRIIRIRAEDSPNVKMALLQKAMGRKVTGRDKNGNLVVDGVLTWEEYCHRRETYDKVRACISLDAQFWEGAEALVFPPEWLNRAERLAMNLVGRARWAKGIGIDPAEGGDKTAMAAVDEYGLIELISKQTPDTNMIPGEALWFMRKHNVPPDRVCFDRGGGGKQHADRLRASGYPVRTIAFGESISPMPKRGKRLVSEAREFREEATAYLNRRAQMYYELRELLDPGFIDDLEFEDASGTIRTIAKSGNDQKGFAIPAKYDQLRQQLAPIPRTTMPEGTLYILPKTRKPGINPNTKTLIDLIGHSPDEADALVLAVHAMLHRDSRITAGAIV